jgi:hypothetical protein
MARSAPSQFTLVTLLIQGRLAYPSGSDAMAAHSACTSSRRPMQFTRRCGPVKCDFISRIRSTRHQLTSAYGRGGFATKCGPSAVILPHGGPEGQVTLTAPSWSCFWPIKDTSYSNRTSAAAPATGNCSPRRSYPHANV